MLGSIRARSWLRRGGAAGGHGPGRESLRHPRLAALVREARQPLLAIRGSPTGNDKEKRPPSEAFYKRLQVMASNGIIRLPKGSDEKSNWDAESIEADAGGWQGCRP